MNLTMQSRLSVLLAVCCGAFAVLAGAFWMGVGDGYQFGAPDADARPELPSLSSVQNETFSLPDFAHFAEITQRPLFAADRRPIPPGELAQEDKKPDKPPVPLKVKLTGVIITPDLKLAMLQDQTANKGVSLHEGMPLPGKQSAWVLVEVKPRMVVFKNDRGEKSEVELKVAKTSGSPERHVTRVPDQASKQDSSDDPEKKVDDSERKSLREKIEARRAQLRERAAAIRAKRKAQRQKQQD